LRPVTIARNYAEALFALAEKSGRTEAYATLMDAVAGGIAAAPSVQAVLMSPKVTKAQKSALLADALQGSAPKEFVLFLQSVIRRGRQGLFDLMATEYLGLLDLKLERVRASVTTARPADEALRQKITARLTEVMGQQVLPHFVADPGILGGIVVRVGDRVFDGSVKRRMAVLRRALLAR
jgi:F-type H+-transporting ATPase subunit delta